MAYMERYTTQKHGNQWRVRDKLNGRTTDLGIYRTPQEAEQKIRLIETEQYNRRHSSDGITQSSETIEDLYGKYLSHCKSLPDRYSEATLALKEEKKIKLLAFFKSVRDLNKSKILDYRESLQETIIQRGTKQGQKYAPGTIGKYLSELKSFVFWLEAQDLIQKNPMRGIVVPQGRMAGKVIPAEVMAELLARARPKLKAFLYMKAVTGARWGEVFNMEWKFLDGNVLTLDKTKNGDRRTCFVPPEVLDMIKQYDRVDDKIFGFYSPHTARTDWEYIKKSYPHSYRPHDLRHTFATKFMKDGKDHELLMKAMGWRDLKTAKRYLHYSNESILDKLKTFDMYGQLHPAPTIFPSPEVLS